MCGQSFLYKNRVSSEWIDYNGHMNDAVYAKVFSIERYRILACGRVKRTLAVQAKNRKK